MSSLLDQPKPPPPPSKARTVTKLNAKAPVSRSIDEADEVAEHPARRGNRVRKVPGAKRGRMSWRNEPDCVKARVLRAMLGGPIQRRGLAELLECQPEDIDWATKDLASEGLIQRTGARRFRWYDITEQGRELAQQLESRAREPSPPRRRPDVDVAADRSPVTTSAGKPACDSNAGSRRGPVADLGTSSPYSAAVSRCLERWFSCGIFLIGMSDTHVQLAIPIERITDPSVMGMINLERP